MRMWNYTEFPWIFRLKCLWNFHRLTKRKIFWKIHGLSIGKVYGISMNFPIGIFITISAWNIYKFSMDFPSRISLFCLKIFTQFSSIFPLYNFYSSYMEFPWTCKLFFFPRKSKKEKEKKIFQLEIGDLYT